MAGDGPWAITVMWIVTVLTFVFVVLRAYTRAIVVKSHGIDDHVYYLAFVSWPLFGVMGFRTRGQLILTARFQAIPPRLHHLDHHSGALRIRAKHGRHHRDRRPHQRHPLRGHRADVCRRGDGRRQVVAGSLPAPPGHAAVAQDRHMDRHGEPDGRLHLGLLRLLAAVHPASVPLRSEDTGRLLPHQHDPCLVPPLQ
jgi:hypothetical protein